MDDKMSAYEAEVKRQREMYGPRAEIPRTPWGAPADLTAPVKPIEVRIAGLAKEVAEAGHRLSIARARFVQSVREKEQEEQAFLEVS